MKPIGIDAGGTLLKIAHPLEQGILKYESYPVDQAETILAGLTDKYPDLEYCITGGKSGVLRNKLPGKWISFPEFDCICKGSAYLFRKQKGWDGRPFLLVSVGTGTSLFYVDESEQERVGGTGIGGGTFLGLGRLLTGENRFSRLVHLAEIGNREPVDLLVRDLYEGEIPPIPGDLTAANFAKASAIGRIEPENAMAALIHLIGETLLLLALETKKQLGVDTLVFVGGLLEGNRPLRKVLTRFQTLFDYKAVFLEKGIYAGATGAWLLGKEE
jgi:Fumble.